MGEMRPCFQSLAWESSCPLLSGGEYGSALVGVGGDFLTLMQNLETDSASSHLLSAHCSFSNYGPMTSFYERKSLKNSASGDPGARGQLGQLPLREGCPILMRTRLRLLLVFVFRPACFICWSSFGLRSLVYGMWGGAPMNDSQAGWGGREQLRGWASHLGLCGQVSLPGGSYV